ncbi:MAG TPA: FAD-dependent oxidoreductase [Acetobacteraceae bacterium]
MHVVVVGAGILGASTAFHLARAGARVTVVDQAHDGRATAAGAGIICPWVSGAGDAHFYRLYVEGARYYTELVPVLAEHGETELGYRRVGALVVSSDTDELRAFERLLQRRRASTPEMGETTVLAPHDASLLFPPLRDDFTGLHVANGARVDGRLMASGLLCAAQRLGARLVEAHAELITDGKRLRRVRAGSEVIEADSVVVVAGAWAAALLQPLRIELPIEPQRGQIVHLRLPGVDTRGWPVVLPQGSHYLLAFDDSRIVAGATREPGVGFDYRVTAAGQAEVLAEALNVAPGLASATIIETRVGFRPLGAGIRPLLGKVPDIDGLLVGNGLGAAGLTIGPFAGRVLAEVALGGEPPIDLAPFDPMQRATGGLAIPPLR